MRIGVPTEIKPVEARVAMVPGGVQALVGDGHEVLVQRGAGLGSGIKDEEFAEAGAKIIDTAEEVWGESGMIVKVKEPLEPEYALSRPDHLLFTYFHFAASRPLTEGMVAAQSACFAYETLEIDGRLPLLIPMSEVAGRLSIQCGAYCLEKAHGGRGMLLGGVPGVEPANVLVLGGGTSGTHAAMMAAGMGAHVTIMDVDLDRLRYLQEVMPANCDTVFSSPGNIRQRIPYADLVVGAVLLEGARAPTLVPREYLKHMKPGSVIVDIAVDQGGCVETIKPTYHDDPTYIVDGVVHYGVANMPGAVPRTSTYALTNATLPFARQLAANGTETSVADPVLRTALNSWKGKVTHAAVAEAFDMEYVAPETLI